MSFLELSGTLKIMEGGRGARKWTPQLVVGSVHGVRVWTWIGLANETITRRRRNDEKMGSVCWLYAYRRCLVGLCYAGKTQAENVARANAQDASAGHCP